MPEATEIIAASASFAGAQTEETRLRSLRRLGQLAGEIQDALGRGNIEIVGQASGLLAAALAQWTEARLPQDEHNPEIGRLMQEARQALAACETALSRAMADVCVQQSQIRRHQKRVKQAPSQKVTMLSAAGKTLNLHK